MSYFETSNMSLTILVEPESHFGLSLLAPITSTDILVPELALMICACSFRDLYKPVATFPHPHIPILSSFITFPLIKSFLCL